MSKKSSRGFVWGLIIGAALMFVADMVFDFNPQSNSKFERDAQYEINKKKRQIEQGVDDVKKKIDDVINND